MEMGGKRHAPDALPIRKTRNPLYRRPGGPQCRSGQVRKISLPPGFDPRIVQPVTSRYTDWAISAHIFSIRHKRTAQNALLFELRFQFYKTISTFDYT